jgi:aldose 1-epimerase
MRLVSGDAELVCNPELGGTIVSWTVAGVSLFRPVGAEADTVRGQGCYPLVPFSNRVAGRAFRFAGQRHELPDLMGGFAIHGAAWQLAWRQEGAAMVVDYPGGRLWPFAFSAEQRFALSDSALTVTLRVVNRHDQPAPVGMGLHPYFPRTPEMTLQFAATSVWLNGPDMIPSANVQVPEEWNFTQPRRPGEVFIDNCFAGWHRSAVLTWPEHATRLSIAADKVFRHTVVFVPRNQGFLALEPVTNMNDGINRMEQHVDHGMTVLAPGAALEGAIRFTVSAA